MAQALDPQHVIDYVLKADRKLSEEKRTIFKLKPIPARTWARIRDRWAVVNADSGRGKSNDDEGTKVNVNMGTQELEALRFGLVGWENFKTKDGRELEFKLNNENHIVNELIDYIRPDDRSELSSAIQSANEPDDKDMANLVSASPS